MSSAHETDWITSPLISDALDRVGIRHQVLLPGFTAIAPGATAVGRARTIQFAPTEGDDPIDPYAAAIAFLDSLASGEVVVIATGASKRSAFWGELFTAAALGRGATGLVTDGALRDTPRIVQLGFPAFSAGRHAQDYRARMRVVGIDEPVEMGGVVISPGDLVVADVDGVASVPSPVIDEVLENARARSLAETGVLADLLAGDSVRAVWERYRTL